MKHLANNGDTPGMPRVLTHAPAELTGRRLTRLGEGVGKVVYASEHWVVKRERSPSEIMALIAVWKLLRKLERHLPGDIGLRVRRRPARQIRFLRVLMQAVVLVVPRSLWFTTHIGEVWKIYHFRDVRGERLAQAQLAGSSMLPETVLFPPIRVKVGGWPGWLTICEATERVEATLDQRLAQLARNGRFHEMEQWLDRFLDLRRTGWQLGVFSVDAHFKNFGVSGDRVVLLDPGGLTNSWSEIEKSLAFETSLEKPHIALGLGPLLRTRPDIAERFDRHWKSTINFDEVQRHWPQKRTA